MGRLALGATTENSGVTGDIKTTSHDKIDFAAMTPAQIKALAEGLGVNKEGYDV